MLSDVAASSSPLLTTMSKEVLGSAYLNPLLSSIIISVTLIVATMSPIYSEIDLLSFFIPLR